MRFSVDGVKHEFDEERITFAEGRAIEKVTGEPFGQIARHAHEGNLTVMQAFIWVALKRDEPTLQFSDLDDRAMADFEFHEDPAEDAEEDARPTGSGASSSSAA